MFGAGAYTLRGQTTIGDTTYLAIQDAASGRTRLLEVGDSDNRSIHVVSWNAESRNAVIMANNQRFELAMEQPTIDLSSPLPAVREFNLGQDDNNASMGQNTVQARNQGPQVVGGSSQPAATSAPTTNATTGRIAVSSHRPASRGQSLQEANNNSGGNVQSEQSDTNPRVRRVPNRMGSAPVTNAPATTNRNTVVGSSDGGTAPQINYNSSTSSGQVMMVAPEAATAEPAGAPRARRLVSDSE